MTRIWCGRAAQTKKNMPVLMIKIAHLPLLNTRHFKLTERETGP